MGDPTIVEEVLEYARVATRLQRRAIVELAFLQEAFGAGFVLSRAIIREQVRFNQRTFMRIVQELLRDGHIVCDHEQRYSIVRTWQRSVAPHV